MESGGDVTVDTLELAELESALGQMKKRKALGLDGIILMYGGILLKIQIFTSVYVAACVRHSESWKIFVIL